MSSRSQPVAAAETETAPAFAIRRDGSGVKMDWRTLVACLAAACFIGGAWYTLQDHGKRIDSLATKVDSDHELLLDIRGTLRTLEHDQRGSVSDRR